MASNSGNSFDAGIERARGKEQGNQPSGEKSATIKGTVVGSVQKNPTSGGKITKK
jgi:hypothetical protein